MWAPHSYCYYSYSSICTLRCCRCGNPLAGNPSLTQARHRQNLALCCENLQEFLELTSIPEEADSVLDLAAEELRTAIRHIGRITGKVGIEEILDVVFKDFCIGK